MQHHLRLLLLALPSSNLHGGNIHPWRKKPYLRSDESTFSREISSPGRTFPSVWNQLPCDIWRHIGEKLAQTGRFRERSALLQVSTATRNSLGTLSFGIPAATPQEMVQFFLKYPESTKQLERDAKASLLREAIAAAKDDNREPAHLRLLGAALEAKYRTTFQQKEQELHSEEQLCLHWIAVLYACQNILMLSYPIYLIAATAAGKAACFAAADDAADSACALGSTADIAARRAAREAGTHAAWDTARRVFWDVAWNTARNTGINTSWDMASRAGWGKDRKATATRNATAARHAARHAAAEAAAQAAQNHEPPHIVGAVAYRSAETAMLLTLIALEPEFVAHPYQSAMKVMSQDGTFLSMHQRLSPLASEEDFNTWKAQFLGALEGDESTYGLVRGMIEELEALANKIFAMRRRRCDPGDRRTPPVTECSTPTGLPHLTTRAENEW